MEASEAREGSLLLEVPVPLRVADGQFFLESQAYQGLVRWLENFDTVSICAPMTPASRVPSILAWSSAAPLMQTGKLTVHPLPWAYHPLDHMREVFAVRTKFRVLIKQHRYLCFSNLGTFGAWGRIAAEEAYSLGRQYAVWLDWVLDEMPRKSGRNPLKSLWRALDSSLLKFMTTRDLKRATLGLFHGSTVYEAYAGLPRVSKLVHDIHLGSEDVIPPEALEARFSRTGTSISILYVGRVHEMKGPALWVKCLERLIRSREPSAVRVKATWIGDGPQLEEMRSLVQALGLTQTISFVGGEPDRTKVLEAYRAADLFLFCHLTPESPRCLIEALMSGLPILGFDSAYARDLIAQGGGVTVPVKDVDALADIVRCYVHDKAARIKLSHAAVDTGRHFSEEAVFRHRADLIKEYL